MIRQGARCHAVSSTLITLEPQPRLQFALPGSFAVRKLRSYPVKTSGEICRTEANSQAGRLKIVSIRRCKGICNFPQPLLQSPNSRIRGDGRRNRHFLRGPLQLMARGGRSGTNRAGDRIIRSVFPEPSVSLRQRSVIPSAISSDSSVK